MHSQLIALLFIDNKRPIARKRPIYKTFKADGTQWFYSDVPSRDSVPVNIGAGT